MMILNSVSILILDVFPYGETLYHPSNMHHYGSGGAIVLCQFNVRIAAQIYISSKTTERRTEILKSYIKSVKSAISSQCIFGNDKTHRHRSELVEEYLEVKHIPTMVWAGGYPNQNPIEHVWDFLSRRTAARHPHLLRSLL